MRHARITFRLVASGLAALAVSGVATAPRAELPADATATSAPVGCVLTGATRLGADVLIYDQAQDGRAIARFTGGETPLRVDAFPSSPGRARVVTATGGGGFRLTGYTETAAIPVFTKTEVAVVEGHLWIGAQREVRVVKGTSARLNVEKSLTTPVRQTFSAWGGCEAFSLAQGTAPGWDVPGNARGYTIKNDSLELFDSGEKDRALVARLEQASGMLLWSTATKGGFVQVQYQGEIAIEAWAPAKDLKALPWGERQDSALPPVRRSNPPQLKLAEVPKEVTTKKEVTIRDAPRDSGAVLGVIEPNTATYVLDVVVGWASVLPKSLHVAPVGEGQFWVPAADLGLGK